MKLIEERIIDVPVCMFKLKYGINIDDALDLCHERGKIVSPIIGQKILISTGNGVLTMTRKQNEFYFLFLSDLIIKNDVTASFKEEIYLIS